MPSNASRCRRSDDPVATAIAARSAQPGGHTNAPVDCSPSRRSRRNGPASWPTGGHAGRRSADAGYSGTSPSPPPALGHSGPWPAALGRDLSDHVDPFARLAPDMSEAKEVERGAPRSRVLGALRPLEAEVDEAC